MRRILRPIRAGRLDARYTPELFMADNSLNGAFQLTLPKELVSAANRQPPKTADQKLRVEGWRTSWLSRLSEVLIGKD
jgi:hypothetical protein